MKKTPHPVDVTAGKLIRERRLYLGLTQTDLAVACGIRFQQIQKYETAQNRVSLSRISDIAEVLDVKPAYFFQEAG